MKWSPPEIEEYIEIFSSTPTRIHQETEGDEHEIITQCCYGRDISLSKVGLPRMPKGIRSRVTIDTMSLETAFKYLPKRRGRGRAKMLEEREDHFNNMKRNTDALLPYLDSIDKSSIDSLSTRDFNSESSSLFGDCEFSESDDSPNQLLPSQHGNKLPDRPLVFPDQLLPSQYGNKLPDRPLVSPDQLLPSQYGNKLPDRPLVFPDQLLPSQYGNKLPDRPLVFPDPLLPSQYGNKLPHRPLVSTDHFFSAQHGNKLPHRSFIKPPAQIYNHKSVIDFPSLGAKSESLQSDNSSSYEVVVHKNHSKKIKKEMLKQRKNSKNSLSKAENILSTNTIKQPIDSKRHSAASGNNTTISRKTSLNACDKSKNSILNVSHNKIKVNDKKSKDKTKTNESKTSVIRESGSRNSVAGWSVKGCCVVQMEGMPISCDLEVLEETLSNFGVILDSQVQVVDGKYAMRYRFSTEDVCEWVVTSLHDTDMLYPESHSVLVCFKVED